jgi:predicted Zn-ribbon and HTH transcriptional regulator
MIWSPFGYIRITVAVALILAAAVLAIRALIQDLIIRARLRKYRTKIVPGHCAGCGYDLRASPERCPECGRPSATPRPPPRKLL